MEIGSVYIETQGVETFFSTNSTTSIIIFAMAVFGWVILVATLLYLGVFLLKFYKEEKVKQKWEWVLLAIDIPPLNMQTPKAVEQMFAHLAGAFYSPSIADKFRAGFKQRWFSFEIVSIEGYIQFLVRTEAGYRDLVEAAVYAQYPEAEIVEVEDYTADIPDKFPDEDYDMWGGDFGLAESFAYPIRTYTEFEHSISKDEILKDPMGTFLESFSRIGQGEQMWFQLLVEPIDNSWKEKVIGKIKDIVGEMVGFSTSKKKSSGLLSSITGEPMKALSELTNQLSGGSGSSSSEAQVKKEEGSKLSMLTPGQRKLLEVMEDKITKIGFKTKMRAVYVGRKEVFRPERSVNALIGAINQYNIPSANSIIPTSTVSTNYFYKTSRNNRKKSLMIKAYKKRNMKSGGNSFVFNIEELATVWHFPMSHVRTPLLQRSEGKRAEPPAGLPIESVFEEKKSKEEKSGSKFMTDAGYVPYPEDQKFG
jgi:hypothetical protein